MEKNKKYATNITKCSMLIAMIVLGSVTATISAASREAFSLNSQSIFYYFDAIPSSKDFGIWKKGVMDVVTKYKLEEDLKDRIEDIDKIEVLIKPFDKKEEKDEKEQPLVV